MDEFISRFTFNEGTPVQKTYYDSITKQEVIFFTTYNNKKNSTVAEKESQSFGEFALYNELTCHKQALLDMLKRRRG